MSEAEATDEAAFARALAEKRPLLGMSQADLAQRIYETTGIKLDPTAITRLERGSRGLRLNEASAIAGALGTTVQDMLAKGKRIASFADESKRKERALQLLGALVRQQIDANRRLRKGGNDGMARDVHYDAEKWENLLILVRAASEKTLSEDQLPQDLVAALDNAIDWERR